MQQLGYKHKHSIYRVKERALDRADSHLAAAQQLLQAEPFSPKKIADNFIEAGIIHFLHSRDGRHDGFFSSALEHDSGTAFFLFGLNSVRPLSPSLKYQSDRLARALDTGTHEDGSMESAVPYLENIVKSSDFIYSGPANNIARIVRHKMNLKKGVILDIGTGPAPFAIAVAKLLPAGFRVIGYDVSDQMLDLARGRIVGLDLNIDLVKGPILDARQAVSFSNCLPFPSEFADVIISHGSMHHWGGGNHDLASVSIMFQEFIRLLKPFGRLLIYDINPAGLGTKLIMKSRIMKLLNRRYQHEAFVHSALHSLDRHQIRETMQGIGVSDNYALLPATPLFPTGLIFHVIEYTKGAIS
jgi:SAM-dependent methyltransferase